MVINSLIFLLFFVIFLLPYFVMKERKMQNAWVLLASYVFYGWTDWRMLGLLLVATIVFYGLAISLSRKNPTLTLPRREGIMILGVVFGVGMLLYFKYMNFFIEQIAASLGLFGIYTNWSSFNIIVPIGISFFTFKLISYIIEVYKGNIEVERNFIDFAAYVAFFPTIMSGPIDKPNSFIPQLKTARRWNDAMALEGCKRILWGLFLKMCIADKVSPYTDSVFNNYYHHSGITIILASVLYTFQIYADFCGYSEMAIGVSQIMGFKVTENFKRPLFSTNCGDFWRRWHMSLMAFFREYVYFPLGGSRCSEWKIFRNTMVTFFVSGLWHGANWTFVIWGGYHGVLVYAYRRIKSLSSILSQGKGEIRRRSKLVDSFSKYASILIVFVLCTIGWMVFRCDTFQQFFGMLGRIFAPGGLFFSWALTAVLPIGIMLLKELKDEEGWNLHFLHAKNYYVQAVSIALLVVYVFYTGELNGAQFIYFQF